MKNTLYWLITAILVIGGIAANYHFADVAGPIRAAVGIVLAIITLVMAAQTTAGGAAWGFVKASRTELRKVTWPNRKETIQTTIMVIVMVLVAALIMWGFDYVFMNGIGWLSGQRG